RAAMNWSDIPRNPSTRTLRQFAGLWVVFFGGLAAWHGLRRGETTAGCLLAALALTVGPAGLVWPRLLRPAFVGRLVPTLPVGWLVSRVALGLLFFGLFTPLALWFRVIGRDVLGLEARAEVPTYWKVKPPPVDSRSYFHPY